MKKSQLVFESIMRIKGHLDFTMERNKYVNPGLQNRWLYFQMGWEMCEVTK